MTDDHLIDLDAEESEAEEAASPRPKKEKGGRKGAKKPKEASPLKVLDRRFWARRGRAEDEDGEGEESAVRDVEAAPLSRLEIEGLRRDLEAKDAKLREVTEAYLKGKDEMERFRARSERDAERRLASAKAEFLRALLPVLDGFDRAFATLPKEGAESDTYRKGMEMIRGQFEQFLAAAGLARFAPVGEAFDPNLAEAVEAVPVEDEARDGVVLETLAAGYRLGETLLRPASVRVGKLKKPA